MDERAIHAIRERHRALHKAYRVQNRGLRLHEMNDGEEEKFTTEVLKHTKTWLTRDDIYGEVISRYLIAIYKAYPLSPRIFGSLKLNIRISGSPELNPGISGSLEDVLGSERLSNIEIEFIEFLKSIPRTYQFDFLLSEAQGLGVQEVKIGKDLSLYEVLDGYPRPQKDSNLALLAAAAMGETTGVDTNLEKGDLTVRIVAKGFAGYSLDTSAKRSALATFKQFVILSAALNFFKLPLSNVGFGLKSDAKIIMSGPGLGIEDGHGEQLMQVPENVLRLISKIEIQEFAAWSPLRGLLGTFVKLDETLEERRQRVEGSVPRALGVVAKVVSSPSSDEDGSRLKAASEWAFDSLASDNETIAFIQLSVAFEALLGEKENEGRTERGVTELLADRCAYLLGGNSRRRGLIRKRFGEFYKVRSKIIHGREPTLPDKDRALLYMGRTVLLNAIRKNWNF